MLVPLYPRDLPMTLSRHKRSDVLIMKIRLHSRVAEEPAVQSSGCQGGSPWVGCVPWHPVPRQSLSKPTLHAVLSG